MSVKAIMSGRKYKFCNITFWIIEFGCDNVFSCQNPVGFLAMWVIQNFCFSSTEHSTGSDHKCLVEYRGIIGSVVSFILWNIHISVIEKTVFFFFTLFTCQIKSHNAFRGVKMFMWNDSIHNEKKLAKATH